LLVFVMGSAISWTLVSQWVERYDW
jgi:hypothetical protein